jgi:hypothetical protein
MKSAYLLILASCWIGSVVLSFGQADTLRVIGDITSARRLVPKDSLAQSSGSARVSKYQPSKKPWVAVGLSAALPGLGQIYNKSYWKLPILWGLGGYWIYEWNLQNNRYQDFRQKYSASVAQHAPNNEYLTQRDFYRNQRDSFAWYLGAAYFLNLVDAYVGASLYDFDVSPDLSADGKIFPKVTATVRLGL